MQTKPNSQSNIHVVTATCPACGHCCDQHMSEKPNGQVVLVCDNCGHTRAASGK